MDNGIPQDVNGSRGGGWVEEEEASITQCIVSANLLEIWQIKILVFPPSASLLGVKASDATRKKCAQTFWSKVLGVIRSSISLF